MQVTNKSSDDFTVLGPDTKAVKLINKVKPTLGSIPVELYKEKASTLFSASWVYSNKVVDKINALYPDIVHLHWINGGMIRIEDFPKIKASIVWTLHDMWAFTGGCHYDGNCGDFKDLYGKCVVLGSQKTNDLSQKVFIRKQKIFHNFKQLTINNCWPE